MKFKVFKEVEIEVTHINIDVKIRHVGDSDDDDVPSKFPMLNGDTWEAVVEIETGRIEGWIDGTDACNLYAKVCDAGVYTLLNSDGETEAVRAGYVPHGVVPGDYGDYISLNIGSDGVITNWPKSIDVSDFFESED